MPKSPSPAAASCRGADAARHLAIPPEIRRCHRRRASGLRQRAHAYGFACVSRPHRRCRRRFGAVRRRLPHGEDDRPHLQPFYGDYAALVSYARADDVVASVIDGRVVMHDRRVVNVDEGEIHRALSRHTPRWQQRLVEIGALRATP
jgi:hypothetical protein